MWIKFSESIKSIEKQKYETNGWKMLNGKKKPFLKEKSS